MLLSKILEEGEDLMLVSVMFFLALAGMLSCASEVRFVVEGMRFCSFMLEETLVVLGFLQLKLLR